MGDREDALCRSRSRLYPQSLNQQKGRTVRRTLCRPLDLGSAVGAVVVATAEPADGADRGPLTTCPW
jgi:hypothetical protein